MKKMIYSLSTTATCLSLIAVSPVLAWDQTDENNMPCNKNVIKITNMYSGPWKGWADGCVNCDKPSATRRLKGQKKSKANKKKASKETVNTVDADKAGMAAKKKPTLLISDEEVKDDKSSARTSISDSDNSKDNKGADTNSADKKTGTLIKENTIGQPVDPSMPVKSDSSEKDIKSVRNMDVRDTSKPKELLEEKARKLEVKDKKKDADAIDTKDGLQIKEELKKEKSIDIKNKIKDEIKGKEEKKNMFDLFSFLNP